ncbi:MAG TPA: histidine kinase [Mycobacteriales bacterium]|nr:histidine kinase [Mycobacteriales bacterium]
MLAGAAGLGLLGPAGPVGRDVAASWLLFGCACLVCGEALRGHRPAQPVGVLLSTAGLLLLAAAAGAPRLPVDAAAVLAILGGLTAFPLALAVFPDRPLPRVAGPVLVGTVVLATGVALVHPTYSGTVGSMALVVAVAGIASVWWRYEAAAAAERSALLWLVLAGVFVLVAGGLPTFLVETTVPAVAAATAVPVALVVGVLRPAAADVRSLTVRGVVLAVTVALYVAVFSGLLAAIRWQGADPSGGALGTLGAVLAIGFQPARTVLQGVIDELLFGDRADPGRAMAGVGERLADDPVLALRALRQSLVLPYAALLADGEVVASSGTASTPTRGRPLQAGPATVGELVVGLRSGELRLRPSDEAVLDVVAPALGQALHARQLATELRRSRGEVISVVEEERRRLRRDLHDGLGPTLTGVAYAADAARNLLGTDPTAADALLADLRADTTHAIAEVRRLVEGLRPPMLDELGLTQAIRQRARQMRTADGRALVVTLEAPDPLPDVPAAVEVVAFRIVVEALTNVCRHAASDRAAVALRLAGGVLDLEIRDAGRNPGPWAPGVGLASMRERAEAVGGTCTATPTPTGGHVTARLPLPAP